MLGLPSVLFTVAALLILVGILQPLAARLNLSHTVLLAVVGVLIGVAAGFLLGTPLTNAFNEVAELILDFPITSTGFLYIFLPVLLFEAALTIDVRRLLEDAAPIFVLAVIAVLATTAAVGLALWPSRPCRWSPACCWPRSSPPPILPRWWRSFAISARRRASPGWSKARACSTTPPRSRSSRSSSAS